MSEQVMEYRSPARGAASAFAVSGCVVIQCSDAGRSCSLCVISGATSGVGN